MTLKTLQIGLQNFNIKLFRGYYLFSKLFLTMFMQWSFNVCQGFTPVVQFDYSNIKDSLMLTFGIHSKAAYKTFSTRSLKWNESVDVY